MKLVFVSDIHLQSPSDQTGRRLTQFLDRLEADTQLTELILLGDIFDLWVGDHEEFLHKFFPIISRLLKFKSRGINVHYFEGNHDFHLSKLFADQFKFVVHDKPHTFKVGDHFVRVEHGDEMDPNDKGYIFLRKFFRSKPLKWLAYNLPGWLVCLIGENLSHKSRTYTSQVKTIDSMQALNVIRNHAEKTALNKKFDYIVSGHMHIRDDFKIKVRDRSIRSINLGSWFDKPCAFELRLDGVELQAHWVELQ